MRLDHLRPHDQSGGDVQRDGEDDVRGQEGLGEHDSPNGAVVERAFEPLAGVRLRQVVGESHHVARERADSFAAHGVAFVGHGGGADLVLAERFLHLLQVGEETDVARHLVERRGDAGERGEDVVVGLARVGLSAHGDGLLEAHQLAHAAVQRHHLLLVAVEQLHERGLRPRGALHAAEGEVLDLVLQVLQVDHQVLVPQGRSLAHRHQLRRLVVREAQGRKGLVLLREVAQSMDHTHKLAKDQVRGFTNLDQIGVVANVAGSRAQVDDRHRVRTQLAERMNVRHHVMSQLLLLRLGKLVVDVVDVGLHLIDLLVSDVQTQLLLGSRQSNPQLPPGGELHIRRPDIAHLLRGISRECKKEILHTCRRGDSGT